MLPSVPKADTSPAGSGVAATLIEPPRLGSGAGVAAPASRARRDDPRSAATRTLRRSVLKLCMGVRSRQGGLGVCRSDRRTCEEPFWRAEYPAQHGHEKLQGL